MFQGIADRGFLNLVASFYTEETNRGDDPVAMGSRPAYRRVLEAAVGVPEASRLIDTALDATWKGRHGN